MNVRVTRVVGDSWAALLEPQQKDATRGICEIPRCVSAMVWTEPTGQGLVKDGVYLNRQVPLVDLNTAEHRLDLKWVNDPGYPTVNMYEGDWRLGTKEVNMANVHQFDQAALGRDGVKNFAEQSPLVSAARKTFFHAVGDEEYHPPCEGVIMLPRALGKRRYRGKERMRVLKDTVPAVVVLALTYQVVINPFQRNRLSRICRETYRKIRYGGRQVWVEPMEAEAAFLADPAKWAAEALAYDANFESNLVTLAYHVRSNPVIGFNQNPDREEDNKDAYDHYAPWIFFTWDFLQDVFENQSEALHLMTPVRRPWTSESPMWPALSQVGITMPEIRYITAEEVEAAEASTKMTQIGDNLPVSGKAEAVLV